jgi:flagellar hook-associated protein 1 FlgK
MSLTAAIHIGRSALAASQLGIQIAGNNMANAATPGYSRQVGRFVPIRGDGSLAGISIGAGVQVRSVQRQVDMALQARLWNATSDQAATYAQSQILGQIETILGELGDNDLSSELSDFFEAWSERANQTKTSGAVVQQGDKLASFMRRMRSDLMDQRRQVDGQLSAAVTRANDLMSQIAGYNRAVADAEVGGTTANTLRDQREAAVAELAAMMDVTVIDRGAEGLDVLAGSTPLILGGHSRGLEMRRQTVDGVLRVSVATASNGQEVGVGSGVIGSLLASRTSAVDRTVEKLDTLAAQLIFQVNKLHSTGRNSTGLTSTLGTLAVPSGERGLALNDPANATFAGLPYSATNGGFVVNVRQQSTGAVTSVRINVDLDGITNSGAPGTADDTSAEDIRAALGAVPGLTAKFTPEGKLEVTAAEGFDFSFEDDTSGALAVMGLNAYFEGTGAGTIAVREDLKADPTLLTTGRLIDGVFVENGTALKISLLQELGIPALGGQTIPELWRDSVQRVGSDAAASRSAAQSAALVHDSLESQRAALSGVSIDEEAISLMDYQRQYQGAARLISVADELTRTLMDLV